MQSVQQVTTKVCWNYLIDDLEVQGINNHLVFKAYFALKNDDDVHLVHRGINNGKVS